MGKNISVVIPVYNSEQTISKVIDRLKITLEETEQTYEIILVNDASKDKSLEECRRIAKENKDIKVISFSRNFGQHHALMAGFRFVEGEYVVCIDDDLQTIPEEIIKLISAIENSSYDVVYASYESKKHNFFRNVGSEINDIMARWLINKPRNLKVSSYFIAKRFVIDEIAKYDKPYPYVFGLVFRVTENVGNVKMSHREREIGKSNYNMSRLIKLWLNGFTNFSVKPLRITSLLGVVFALIGFVFIFVLIIQKLIVPETQLGWTSIMTSIIFFGGVQLMSVGLLGEYIGRIYLSINNTPQYVIKEMFGDFTGITHNENGVKNKG